MPDIQLTPAAKDVLGQLFVSGPTWDGNVTSKVGRDDLVHAGLAFRYEGWQSLTKEGLKLALELSVKNRADQRWHQKQSLVLIQ